MCVCVCVCLCARQGEEELVCMRLCLYGNLCRVFVYVQPPGCERGREMAAAVAEKKEKGKKKSRKVVKVELHSNLMCLI